MLINELILSKAKTKKHFVFDIYFLDKYVEKLRSLSIGGAIKYIKLGNLTDADIPIIDIDKQKEVAANLDKATYLIDLCNTILEKLDLLVKSRFSEMFGDCKNNPKNFRLKKRDRSF